MAFRINRVRAVAADDPAFSEIVTALPDGAGRCLCCRRPMREALAMVLVAEKSNDDPRVLCAMVCTMCSTVYPTDQLLADWAERLTARYGDADVPDSRFAEKLAG